MAIILKNATFINWESLEFVHTNLLVEQGETGGVKFIDNIDEVEVSKDDEVIDCAGKIVTKSFGAGHVHVYSALAKGMPPPVKKPQNFQEILKYIWWTLDKALDKETIEASALATALACAKAGATFAVDHHASPNSIKGSLEIIAEAFDKIGVGHLLCYEVTDRDGIVKAQEGLEETDSYLTNRQGLVGMHASFTVGNDTMEKAAQIMQKHNSGAHIHVAEGIYDQEHCLENYNKRVVERLNDYGFLDSSKTILGHCIHIEEHERELLRNSGAYVVQNTESNLKNKVGYFKSLGLDEKRILLGTDGMHSDMLQSAKAAFFVGQGFDIIDFGSAYLRFRNIHRYIDINGFCGDGENNLVVLDYDSATPVNKDNFLGHFIFGIKSNHVLHVVSDGKLIVKDRIIQSVDEEEVLKFTREQAERLWKKME